MPVDGTRHPDITSGALEDYGYHKILSQSKSIIVNMLENVLAVKSTFFRVDIPELESIQSFSDDKKKVVYVFRSFPFAEKKVPAIVVNISSAKEKKPNMGADNFLYIEASHIQSLLTSTGEVKSWNDFYAGMAEVTYTLTVMAESPDERMKLVDIIMFCFSHYYRGHYIYQGNDGSLFSIVPATREIDFGGENQLTDESNTEVLYTSSILIDSFIEYIFPSIWDGTRYREIEDFRVFPTIIPR